MPEFYYGNVTTVCYRRALVLFWNKEKCQNNIRSQIFNCFFEQHYLDYGLKNQNHRKYNRVIVWS